MDKNQKLNSLILLFCLVAAALFLVSNRWREEEPAEPEAEEESFLCRSSDLYTYDEMVRDIDLMRAEFPNQFRVDSLAETADGRELFDIRVGSRDASRRIIVNGAIHAQDHMASRLIMCQIVDLLDKAEKGAFYNGNEITEVLEDTEIHFIPMLNPDGVTICQLGLKGIRDAQVKVRIRSIAAQDGKKATDEYLSQWDSNANGVDLNRNFDALWEKFDDGVHHPSFSKYKGASVECETESAAIADLIRSSRFSAILCYHTRGEVIYWYFRQTGELRKMTGDFAEVLSSLTGYRPDVNFQTLDPAGLKDWAVEEEGIPGYTIKIGPEGGPPEPSQFRKIWEENRHVVLETAVAAAEGRIFRILPETLEPGDLLRVAKCSDFINLRAKPSPNAQVLAEIPLGAEVTFEAYANDEYYRVTYQGQTGYAMITYLE